MLENILTIIASSGISIAIVAWPLKTWLTERIQQNIRHQYQDKLERLKADIKSEFDHKLELHKSEVKAQEIVNQSKWEIKRISCLEALEIVDTVFANLDWGGFKPASQEPVDVAKARACYNKLAITCESPEVLDHYKHCLGVRPIGDPARNITADSIVDLRNAIRKELGFGSEVDKDRMSSWIAMLPGSKEAPALVLVRSPIL